MFEGKRIPDNLFHEEIEMDDDYMRDSDNDEEDSDHGDSDSGSSSKFHVSSELIFVQDMHFFGNKKTITKATTYTEKTTDKDTQNKKHKL